MALKNAGINENELFIQRLFQRNHSLFSSEDSRRHSLPPLLYFDMFHVLRPDYTVPQNHTSRTSPPPDFRDLENFRGIL